METQKASAGKDGANRTAIIVAVIGGLCLLGGTIGAAIIEAHRSDNKQVPTYVQPQTLNYVGIVTTDGGKPIPNATVLAVQDQDVGQTIHTDSNGQFQIQLPPDAHSLRLKVDAAGYREEKIEANIHRTGPEEIFLHAIALAPPAITDKSQVRPKIQLQAPAPLISPTSQPNQGIINNAPNQGIQNNCAPGVVNCDQSVHIDSGPPLPNASYRQSALSRDQLARELPFRFGKGSVGVPPAIELVISVDKVFQLPTFKIDCDAPCLILDPQISEGKGESVMVESTSFASAYVTADSRHYEVTLAQPLSPRQGFMLIVTSRNQDTPKITNVVTARSPE